MAIETSAPARRLRGICVALTSAQTSSELTITTLTGADAEDCARLDWAAYAHFTGLNIFDFGMVFTWTKRIIQGFVHWQLMIRVGTLELQPPAKSEIRNGNTYPMSSSTRVLEYLSF